MNSKWVGDAIFYHLYPLGLCDAPQPNDFKAGVVTRLEMIYSWLDHIQNLGANAIYLGPVFESTAHGYDTADYFRVDRRLGTNETLKNLICEMKRRGFRVVLDGVFNHVGRDFWAFQDVLQHGEQSPYCNWFSNLRFDQKSPYGDAFSYEGWAGHYDLVKLNLENEAVRQHLFDAVTFWIEFFDIDGLRLDAADKIQLDFFRDLRQHCDQQKPDFWLMGEVVHGDYRLWANETMLDATTNYECYKGLYSSHVDRNYFEIAYSLNRQFGPEGIYRDLLLYNFVDNHDVNRVATNLSNPAHLYTIYGLLFTMPGIPSVYYGSEWGIEGRRTETTDRMLRPAIDLHSDQFPHPHLCDAIRRLAHIRRNTPALRYGHYKQLHVAPEQLGFEKTIDGQTIIVVVNAAAYDAIIPLRDIEYGSFVDLLNHNQTFDVHNRQVSISVPCGWLRILEAK
ncbi:MAG: alpha-amylase [Anaerolineae bacterium]|nr:alpha-amylase [Anaerolineae bacterium]